MAQPLSSRQDLKRDPFEQWVHRSLDWIAAHRQNFFSVVGTVAVTLAIAFFVYTNYAHVRKEAWDRYAAGLNWANSNQPENGLKYFDDVLNNYSHTPAVLYALLGKADLLYRQGKFPEALQTYKLGLEKEPNKTVLPLFLSGIGASQEQTGDYSASITTYRQFISEFPDHILTPKIYQSLARVLELSHNPDSAKEIYEKIITIYPATPWAEKARLRYQTISPQPFQNASPTTTPALEPK